MINLIYIATDGDGIGQLSGRAALSDNVDELHAVSDKIQSGNDIIAQFVQSVGGQIINIGGDETNASIPADSFDSLDMVRKDYQFATGNTLTVGVGSKISEANKALHVAKLNGKDQVLMYSPEVETQWAKAQQDANEGTATGEAKKIGDAYMKNNDGQKPENDGCPACKEYDNKELEHNDDCPMCQQLDAQENADGTAGMDDCPACQEYDNKELSHNDGCPMCQKYDEEQSEGGEQPEEDSADHPDDCPECQKMFSEASENQPSEDGDVPLAEQGIESEQEILDAIDAAPGVGQTPADAAKNIDDTQLPQGQAMDGNKSVPENFGDAQENAQTDQPGQEGQGESDPSQSQPRQSEEQPQMAGVLQESLDGQADDIQRQRVVDMVGQTLQSFKANKECLEQMRDQFPEFYSANVQMLKAMIELCKLLGLEPKKEQAAYPQDGSPSPAPAAAPQEGAAQPPQQ